MKLKNLILLLLVMATLLSCNQKKKKEVETVKTSTAVQELPLAEKVTNVFEEKFGVHNGKRRNHISGFCFTGEFTVKDAEIKKYSKSAIFSDAPLKVTGRFSHKGGVKKDESAPGEYGMAFEIILPDGSIHNISMNTLDFFPVKTPEGFLQLMQAKVTGKKEDFEKVMEDHPEFKNYKAHYKDKPKELKGYVNQQFNSVNSFYFENVEGHKTPVRWSFVPNNEPEAIDTTEKVNFYMDMQQALDKYGTLSWVMEVYIANENDLIDDASAMWTGNHKTIVAATLTVNEIMPTGACDDKNFDPLQLQEGISPSDDPVLKFRSPTYAMSFARRMRERNSK